MSDHPQIRSGSIPITWLVRVGLGLLGTLLLSHGGWMTMETLMQRQALTETQARLLSTELRISSLESGRTTPMAAETRAELNAVWRKLDELNGR